MKLFGHRTSWHPLGTRHRTKRRIFDSNRIIVTNFMNNWKFNKTTARLFRQSLFSIYFDKLSIYYFFIGLSINFDKLSMYFDKLSMYFNKLSIFYFSDISAAIWNWWLIFPSDNFNKLWINFRTSLLWCVFFSTVFPTYFR